MPDSNTPHSLARIAVIDIGSNSLRLVVFERLGRPFCRCSTRRSCAVSAAASPAPEG